jgi:hypothetical protein
MALRCSQKARPLRVGQYIGYFLLMCIPILKHLLLFMWGFGPSAILNKIEFRRRAALILSAVMLILWIVTGGIIMSVIDDMLSGY